jgi:hypothetical protein
MQFTNSNAKFKQTLFITALLSLSPYTFAADMMQPQVPIQQVVVTVPAGTVIPMLDMQFNCGTCEQDNKIKALVEGAYLDQLELEKATVDEVNKTVLNVTHFRSRGKARFFIGALAGVDNITGTVSCNGAEHAISDTAISAINGIESVARNVGKDAYRAVKACVLGVSTPDTTSSPASKPNNPVDVPASDK